MLVDRRSQRLLAARAHDSVALTEARRAAFAAGVRGFVTYSDTAAVPRLAIVAAREHGAAVVHAQHGLFGYLPREADGRPAAILDGASADVAAVWSDRERTAFDGHLPGRVEITGNPGASDLRGSPPAPSGRAALVLAQMGTPLSTLGDARVSANHLRTALTALTVTRGESAAIVRPHPLDRGRAVYERVAAEFPKLDVRIESSGSIESAVAAADVCIGAVSTATLQAAALGTPSILLDTTGMPLEWPFDGSGDFPTARSADELGETLVAATRTKHPTGRDAALHALGARPGAADAVVQVVADLVR